MTKSETTPEYAVALLTGGSDRPYVYGLTASLLSKGTALDLIGSDELDFPEFRGKREVNLLKLRGDQSPNVSVSDKVFRTAVYYAKLVRYTATAKPRIFHILWNNRFECFDRTLLMLYYKLLGKKIVLTAHNVNADKRDGKDTRLNRFTLRIQYRLCDHIFVHTEKMKFELTKEFGIQSTRVTVIPFGINNAAPRTGLTRRDARQRLGIREDERVILFFGRITPYKGLEYLIPAFRQLVGQCGDYRLIIAGKVDRCEKYWGAIKEDIRQEVHAGRIVLKDQFIPDDETEEYFKAADVLVLPYRKIYQSGVLFLGHSFGLPVLASDVGSLTHDIVEGHTGFVFRPEDPIDLVRAVEQYFASDLYANLRDRRQDIRDYSARRHSWDIVSEMTTKVYAELLRTPVVEKSLNGDASSPSLDAKIPS